MDTKLTRRNFVKGGAAAAAGLALAACNNGGGNSGGSDEGSGSAEGSAAEGSGSAAGGDNPIGADPELVKAAQEEGTLVVYGSCEEDHIKVCVDHFTELFGIETQWQRLSTGEVLAKVEEENGNPSADIWFGGTNDPHNVAANRGYLEPYKAKNEKNLSSPMYMAKDSSWHGIYKGILGIFYNAEELERMKIDPPKDWDDLLDEKYKGLIWSSNYNTAGTPKLLLNTMIQMRGHDEGIQYLVDLDKNIQVYTKSGSGPSKNVGTGECVIGIGFLHDAIFQIADQGYDNIAMVLPASGTSFEVGAVSILKGCAHSNAAKLFVEYALHPECVNLPQTVGAYQFLCLSNAKQPEIATEFGLDPDNVIDYDFDDAGANTETYVAELMDALNAAGADTGEGRFQTE